MMKIVKFRLFILCSKMTNGMVHLLVNSPVTYLRRFTGKTVNLQKRRVAGAGKFPISIGKFRGTGYNWNNIVGMGTM